MPEELIAQKSSFQKWGTLSSSVGHLLRHLLRFLFYKFTDDCSTCYYLSSSSNEELEEVVALWQIF